MSIKRYAAHTNIDDFKSDWHESKDGPMVKYEDYAESERYGRQADITIENLERRVEQLAAENAALKAAIKEIVDSAEEAEYDGYFSFVVNPDAIHAGADLIESETPSTDAILAEVRASAIEQFMEKSLWDAANCLHGIGAFDKSNDPKEVQGIIRDELKERVTDFAAQLRQEAK